MIEEIKKEIKSLPHYSEYMQNINGSHWNMDTVSTKGVFEILDKYKFKNETLNEIDNIENYIEELEKRNNEYLNDLEKFHNAWEELKNSFIKRISEYSNNGSGENSNFKKAIVHEKINLNLMQELETKHNIGREE